jgi:hypothetical protein
VKFRCVWSWVVATSVAVTPSCATLGCTDSIATIIHASSSVGPPLGAKHGIIGFVEERLVPAL